MIPQTDREAITMIIEGMIANGAKLAYKESVSSDDVINKVMGVDEAVVYFHGDDGPGWVYFVLGNEPIEVASDHTVNLSKYIDPIVQPWWGT